MRHIGSEQSQNVFNSSVPLWKTFKVLIIGFIKDGHKRSPEWIKLNSFITLEQNLLCFPQPLVEDDAAINIAIK